VGLSKVVPFRGQSVLIDPESPGRAPEPVEESELELLRLDECGLASWIAETNGLRGKRDFSGPLWSIGHTSLEGLHAVVYYVGAATGRHAIGSLLVTSENIANGRLVVALTATLDWVDAASIQVFEGRRVLVVELSALLSGHKFDLSRIEIPPLGTDAVSGGEVIRHIDRRLDSLGTEYSGLKRENEVLKQNLAAQLAAIGQKVDAEFFHWIVVILGAGSVLAASKRLKIPNSSLADGLKKYAAKGELYRTLLAMVEARQRGVGKRSIERFNEEFAEHQPPGDRFKTDLDLLRALLDGLQEMKPGNWESMRNELVELVEEGMPEK